MFRSKISFFIAICVIGFFGCAEIEQDNLQDQPDESNQFKIGQTTHFINSGILGFIETLDPERNSGDTGSFFLIEFLSENVGFDANRNYQLTGSGEVLYIQVLSESPDGLKDGSYEYFSGRPFRPNTWNHAAYNLDFEEGVENLYTDLLSGSLSVKNSGNQIEISFTFLDEDQQDVTGYYKGEILRITHPSESD